MEPIGTTELGKKLNVFAYDNKNLEKLESKLKEFNPFEVLKADEFEIRHSYFLAWLLNPSENHRLGDYVLKKFIKEVMILNDDKEYPFHETMNLDLSDVRVFRELYDIDILLVSELNKFVVLIENKIKASESKNQLRKYLDYCRKQYQGFRIVPVLLTLHGDEPSEEEYSIISYESLYDILKFSLEIWSEHISQKVIDFISYYIKTLEGLLMKDETISKLCKQIYTEHKEAINEIMENIGSDFNTAITQFMEKNTDLKELNRGNNRIVFLPKKLIEKMPNDLMQSWWSQYPIQFWFNIFREYNKFGFIIEVGPFKDQNKRVNFLKYLRNAGFENIKDSAMSVESKYTRIHSDYPKFHDWDNQEALSSKLIECYEHNQESVKRIWSLVEKYDFK